MNSYHIIGELKLEERYSLTGGIVPGETGVGREIPRLNQVVIFIMECSVMFVSSLRADFRS